MIIENYLVTQVIDSDPLTRSYITRARGLPLPFVHRSCSFPALGLNLSRTVRALPPLETSGFLCTHRRQCPSEAS